MIEFMTEFWGDNDFYELYVIKPPSGGIFDGDIHFSKNYMPDYGNHMSVNFTADTATANGVLFWIHDPTMDMERWEFIWQYAMSVWDSNTSIYDIISHIMLFFSIDCSVTVAPRNASGDLVSITVSPR